MRPLGGGGRWSALIAIRPRQQKRVERTELGYRRFRCGICKQGFNERTGTLFNRLQYPTDVICLVVL